jgi:hypothetical protein
MIHIAGSQPNYVTEPSRAAEAMCTVISRECLDLLKREFSCVDAQSDDD